MDPHDLYSQGNLSEAIGASNEIVRSRPTDQTARGFLAVLLCFDGQLERADKQLDVMAKTDPGAAPGISLMRQLVRAEMSRQEFFRDGRLPEFVAQPGERTELHLRASVALRDGQAGEAAELLARAEELRGRTPGRSGDRAIDDFRDGDDLIGGHFEFLTSTGKYYWVPVERVPELRFHAPERPRDLLWRRASVTVQNGPEGDVYVPMIYAPTPPEGDEAARLGRSTDWIGGESEPVRGVGLRTYLVGDEAQTGLELEELAFEARTDGDGR